VTEQLSLARTALRLRLTYHQVRAMLLRGELRGGQDPNGRYYVDASDVERQLSKGSPRVGKRRAGGGR
jgi:hypothetical protein